ncbi:protein rep [Clostridium sardiniense]|uniref:Protein rep n=1 Tax=Clostridium sardiniense TaxID=29369 RepID=A0ABS7L319_CLOSR|nr:protein rep [Clostridium sardiniense]MBY0757476.1 protein rep [Clostridium sardiniense]MDQ0462231.1 plasmid rolling circle replication initiator protein Rep [Clostridium sardiniense]
MKDIEILIDKDGRNNDRPWKNKKIKSILLGQTYLKLGYKKAYRVLECGNYLEFKRYLEDNKLKLFGANFCKDRLCPMCSWRRSLKIFGQVSKVMDKTLEKQEYKFIFLTLTCKNVDGENLSKAIDDLIKSFDKLFKRKIIKNIVKGWFRALEVTHNLDKDSKDYDTYHPHFHIILMVNKSYFKKTDLYITQDKWVELWKDCLKVDYTPIVDVRAFKSNNKNHIKKSIAESAKYTVKDNDYLIEDNIELTESAVIVLDKALKGRRLVAFGGELKKIHKQLKLDDAEEGDLINTNNEEEIRDDLNFIIERYKWSVGYNQYIKF